MYINKEQRWGGDKVLHIEQKMSFILPHIRTHALGWLYTGGDVHYSPAGDIHYLPTVRRQKFAPSLPCGAC